MDEHTIQELIGLLDDSKPEVRLGASKYLSQVTGHPESSQLIIKNNGHIKFSKMIGDNYAVVKYVLTALINLSEDTKALAEITSDDIIEKLFENLLEKDYPLVDLTLMLIANLSRNEVGAGAVLGLRKFGGRLKGLHVYRLLNMFLKNKATDKEKNCYLKLYTEDEKDDPYRYIMLILQNLEEGRKMICDINRNILEDLLCYLYSPCYTRRYGLICLLKNIAKDENYRYIFLDKEYIEKYNIINQLLYVLIGNIPFEGNDIYKVDECVYKDLYKKTRESKVELIHTILEIFVLLCQKREGRDLCRYKGVYICVRNMHKVYDELLKEDTLEIIDELVNQLMGDEEDIQNEQLMHKIYEERGVFDHPETESSSTPAPGGMMIQSSGVTVEEIEEDDDDDDIPDLE